MKNITYLFATILLMLICSSCNAQKKATLAQSPAPAPEPEPANITHLLDVAGPFHTFLKYLESTNVLGTLQTQANKTDGEGLTLFVPKDDSFTSLKNPSLSNLTDTQLKQVILFHALPHFYSLSDFKNLSKVGPVQTFAGGAYTLNFTDVSGTVQVSSGWSVTKISSSVWSAAPVGVYQIDMVLLPEAIFGPSVPSVAAPPPAPEAHVPAADAPSDDTSDADKGPPATKEPSSSYRVVCSLVFALSGVLLLSVI
ncbi:hypothetical protein RND81_09G188500 [Saponaria officinalis]|uniref:FAS1 domain-containing protein n=1 Tax=Saponaria officinalis TaxID=3572 RepID=A0AAW1IPR9_SAPOF